MTEKKSLVITGVSSGIGYALAEYFMSRGYRVFGSIRNPNDAAVLEEKYKNSFTPLLMDITDTESLEKCVTQVEKELNNRPLFGLVNNAGISKLGSLIDQPMADVRAVFEVNSFAALAVSRAFLPLLGFNEKNDNSEQPGRIVNISSVSGGYTVPFLGAYSGSKHALEAFTQALRRELIPTGIHVCAVEPNLVKSNIADDTTNEQVLNLYQNTSLAGAWRAFLNGIQKGMETADEPEVVAKAVAHALEAKKPKARYPLDPSWRVGRWLKDQTFDKILFKATGLNTHLVKK